MQTLARRNPSKAQRVATTNARRLNNLLLMMQFDPIEIGARIKRARLECGLTQEEVAGMGAFSYRSLQGWETGERIPFKHFAELGQLLRKTSEWFLYGDEEQEEGGAAQVRYMELLKRLGEVESQQQEILEALRKRLPESPEDADQ